ncbi:MAG TPA: glycosyltransferase family 4 protein [Candidatus Saccharimonadales bacterium]|nr:glycosyltransferase family 4 protein [Candidatus Saccharimonadales bacterium]
MKILVIVPYFEEPHRWMISGQKTAHELSKDHQVVVVTTGKAAAVEKRSPSLRIYRLKDWFLKDPINYSVIPNLGRRLKAIIAAEKPDAFLINKHMFYSSLAIWPLKRWGKKVIVQTDTFPGINWFPKSKLVELVMRVYARVIGNPILRSADTVVLLHEGLIPVAQKLKLDHRVIHNGIELDKFDAAPKPTDLPKGKKEIWIGYVGRLESVKGWYDLAAVALRMVKKNRQLHFYFIGPTKNAEEKIKEFAHPQIHFIGLRNDVAGLDKLVDIFVMPSLSEGLSNAIMEAMAAGCACAVSRVGGNMVLVQDKVNGRLFESGNSRELEKVLTELADSPTERRRLGQAARQTIENDYSLTKNVAKLAKLLAGTNGR